MSWVKVFLNIAGILLILSKSYALLFNPTLWMDEGYYIGATQALLSGDFFLSHYSFDKPFLLAFWPVVGIASFGLTPLGMRLVGLICYLAAFFVFQQSLNRLAARPVQNFLISFSFFFLPLMHAHGVSAMTEPYLLLAISLFFYWVIDGQFKKNDSKIFHVFMAGFMTKYTMLLWFPVVFLQWIKEKTAKANIKKWAAMSVPWMLLWFVFSLTNATKFASLTWFSSLGGEHRVAASGGIFGEIGYWIPLLWKTLGASFLSGLILFGLGLSFVRRAVRKRDRNFYFFWLPTFIHLLVILFSGTNGYQRYFVTLIPGLAICFALMLNELPNWKFLLWIRAGVVLLLAAFALQIVRSDRNGWRDDPALGRQLSFVSQEYNRVGMIFHTDAVWQSIPYRTKMITIGCTTDECIQQFRVGVKSQNDQVLLKSNSQGGYDLSRLYFPAPTSTEKVQLAADLIQTQLLEKLRMKKSLQNAKIEINAGQSFVLTGDLRGRAIRIQGRFHANEWAEYPHGMNQKRLTLVAQVTEFHVDGVDWTDAVMSIFYGGYAFHLGALPTKWAKLPSEIEFTL